MQFLVLYKILLALPYSSPAFYTKLETPTIFGHHFFLFLSANPQTRKPANPQTRKPVNPQTRKPANPQTRKPANPQTRKPANPQTRKPANPQTRKPANPQTRKPANPQTRTRRKLAKMWQDGVVVRYLAPPRINVEKISIIQQMQK